MAQITVTCPNCSARYGIDPSHLGRAALCNRCNERFVLEAGRDTAPAAAPAPKLGLRRRFEDVESTALFDKDELEGDTGDVAERFEPGQLRETLEIQEGLDCGKVYELQSPEIRMGRGRECQIVVNDDCVSRVHAQLMREAGSYLLEDLQSKNGTYLNGQRITSRVPLRPNDLIQISGTVFAYRRSGPLVRERKEDSGSSLLCTIDATGSSDVMVKTNPERKLQAILRITEALGGTLHLEAVLSKMLDGLFEIFPQADRGLVLLDDGGRLIPKAVKQRVEKHDSIQYSRTIVDKAMAERRAILSEDILQDEQIPLTASVAQLEISSIMCVPLLVQDTNPLGVIQLDTQDRRRKFDADDMQIMASVAHQASVSVEYAQLHRETVKHAQIQKELDVARTVQHSFLPKTTPEVEGYGFWAHYQAAGQVGGDFYDFLRLPNGNQAILIGDVAGKGVPAALMMAKIAGLSKVALLSHPDNVAEAMALLNRGVCDAELDFGLVTLVLCVIDPERHQVAVANAGHMSPMFLRKDSTIDETVGSSVRAFPLGFDRETSYPTDQTCLEPGEVLVLFSDGISEAMNSQRELFSTDRIRRQLGGSESAGPAEIGESLLTDVDRHVGEAEQNDDITLVIVRRDPE